MSPSLEARLAEPETCADGLFGACGIKSWEMKLLTGKPGSISVFVDMHVRVQHTCKMHVVWIILNVLIKFKPK